MPKRILVLIDGHSLAFRAFHALPPDLASPAGELTNAVFGFFSMLLNVMRDHDPQYIAVAFDVGRTYRHDMYPGYKAHRERMPDELDRQVERIKQILTALHIPIVTLEGFEADDVLAALARQAEAQDVPSLIVTGDRDILQVVNDNITVLTSGRRFSDTIVYTPISVYERYQLRPDQLVDFKALIGDKSDEIPGVKGVGEKGAVGALRQYETLDNLYAHIDEVTPQRLKMALIEGKADADLSRKLAHIDFDNVPIRLDLDSCRRGAYDRDAVVELFRELAFRSLVDRLPPNVGAEESGAGAATSVRRLLYRAAKRE